TMVVFLYGLNNAVVFAFLELIAGSALINWLCLVLGAAMVLGNVIRFVLLETGRLTSSWVPNQLTEIFDSTKTTIQGARRNIGLFFFFIMTILEFIVVPLQAATVFSYGVLNLFFTSGSTNFFEAAGFMIVSIPAVPFLLAELAGFDGRHLGLYELPTVP